MVRGWTPGVTPSFCRLPRLKKVSRRYRDPSYGNRTHNGQLEFRASKGYYQIEKTTGSIIHKISHPILNSLINQQSQTHEFLIICSFYFYSNWLNSHFEQNEINTIHSRKYLKLFFGFILLFFFCKYSFFNLSSFSVVTGHQFFNFSPADSGMWISCWIDVHSPKATTTLVTVPITWHVTLWW